MQGRVEAIQALLFFDSEGEIKTSLEMESQVERFISVKYAFGHCHHYGCPRR